MCNFQQCATRLKAALHGHEPSPAMGLTMFIWSCEIVGKTSRGRALPSKGSDRVISSTVLADGRCLKAHVPPLLGYGLLKDYLW
jgi:hypothetical protein